MAHNFLLTKDSRDLIRRGYEHQYPHPQFWVQEADASLLIAMLDAGLEAF